MSGADFLQSYSELAIAIIGFSGVVVALKGRDTTDVDRQQISLSMLILFGSAALLLGVVPQILLEANVTTETIWRAMSVLILGSQIVGGTLRSRQAKAHGSHIDEFAGAGFRPIMLTSIAVAGVNVYLAVFWLYMTSLLIYLLVGVLIFRNLLRPNVEG